MCHFENVNLKSILSFNDRSWWQLSPSQAGTIDQQQCDTVAIDYEREKNKACSRIYRVKKEGKDKWRYCCWGSLKRDLKGRKEKLLKKTQGMLAIPLGPEGIV